METTTQAWYKAATGLNRLPEGERILHMKDFISNRSFSTTGEYHGSCCLESQKSCQTLTQKGLISAGIPVNLQETRLCKLQSLPPAEKEPMAYPKVYSSSSCRALFYSSDIKIKRCHNKSFNHSQPQHSFMLQLGCVQELSCRLLSK